MSASRETRSLLHVKNIRILLIDVHNRGVGNCVGGAEIMVVVVGKDWELGEGSPAMQLLT